MNGQWIGKFTGTTTGSIIANIDERSSYYEGVAYQHVDNSKLPSAAIFFRTKNKDKDFQFRTEVILTIDPISGMTVPWERVKMHYPEDVVFSKFVDVEGSWGSDFLALSWKTNVGVTGSCVLPRSMADKPSTLKALDKEWGSYKEYVAGLERRRFLFRGQNEPWRLQTAFHRAGRANLVRFLNEDVQALHRHLSARTKHVFNLEIPNENGAFFNLLQHHGYPTPLLDWTYSPYVAAFFAYRGISKQKAAEAAPTDKVRIFVFDQAQWREDFNQLVLLLAVNPHLSIGEFLAIENERMIPQQAASTVTNVDDIESYIQSKESSGKTYLSAIDLPRRDRQRVLRELGIMGITAGSLFPGLDGACEELRERNFEI